MQYTSTLIAFGATTAWRAIDQYEDRPCAEHNPWWHNLLIGCAVMLSTPLLAYFSYSHAKGMQPRLSHTACSFVSVYVVQMWEGVTNAAILGFVALSHEQECVWHWKYATQARSFAFLLSSFCLTRTMLVVAGFV